MLLFAFLAAASPLSGSGVPAASAPPSITAPTAPDLGASADLRHYSPQDLVFTLKLDAAAPGDDDTFRLTTAPQAHAVAITGRTPLAFRWGANWFCEHVLGVRWFMPGPDGEYAPPLPPGWRLPALDVRVTPDFASRALYGLTWPGDPAAADLWALRNGLHQRWDHGHALLHVIPWILFGSHPDYFPILEGRRYCPSGPYDYNWQPALTNPGVVARSAAYALRHFHEHPDSPAVSLCINDSICFDQSSDSLAARGPLRWFRDRPDYSDLVFGYMNRVSDAARTDKLLSAYAYYWCENTPTFPVRANILPWLTADRTQWYDRAFRAQDQALILRWTHSGARVVGTYDYLYGAPFLIPRVTPHLIADAIHFEHAAGVKAYFAETNAHWAYDAPKLWMAAHLLTDSRPSADALLDEFYRDFFGPSAAPMRRFYSACESAWLHQPGHARWIKFYQDEDQALLFPKPLRAELWADLRQATAKAMADPVVFRRVQRVADAFAVTDLFCRWYEGTAPAANVAASFRRAVALGAMAPFDLSAYLRINAPAPAALPAGPWRPASLPDPSWRELKAPAALNDITFNWNTAPWLARGEPCAYRHIEVLPLPGGGHAVRYTHAAGERISQWIPATPNALYRATVAFSGHVSPGNEAYLIVSFLDASAHFVGPVAQSRLHPGSYSRPVELHLVTQAPPNAAKVGVGVYLLHQTSADSAEFSRLTLASAQPAAGNQ